MNMEHKLFEILDEHELARAKEQGMIRHVRIKDLTLEELEDLLYVFWPEPHYNNIDVLRELNKRTAL